CSEVVAQPLPCEAAAAAGGDTSGERMRTITSALLVALLLLVPVASATAAPRAGAAAPARRYTYTIERRGAVQANLEEFATGVSGSPNAPRGWNRGNVGYRRVASGGDLRIILASPAAVAAASPGCSAQWSCRVGTQVLINDARW